MKYRTDEKSGKSISALGFGCMRLPREKDSQQLIERALELGINYFDTAYLYPGNEEMLGRILERLDARSDVFLATKLPHAKCHAPGDFKKLFNESLKRLRTDRIDYYLVHNMTDAREFERIMALGFDSWVREEKGAGRICSIGFSFHGPYDEFEKILQAYEWDFCQIQYNYGNENFQAGKRGLKLARERGVPVIIMEPLLGGKLAGSLPKETKRVLRKADPKRSLAAWGLGWLWNQPGILCVLSGMNEMPQLEDNCATASTAEVGMLSERELAAIKGAQQALKGAMRIPCTGCGYCMPCTEGINIPAAFSAYNESYVYGRIHGILSLMTTVGAIGSSPHFLRSCSSCKACVQKCPQGIDVCTELVRVRKRLEPGVVAVGASAYGKLRRRK